MSISLRKIVGVRLPTKEQNTFWDISIENALVKAVEPHDQSSLRHEDDASVLLAHGRFLAPSLCHAHIHLDKCFLLEDPKFSDLEIVKGDFQEAMALTTEAKRRFSEEDLLRRGRRLIRESINAGVTHMRAFVELDADVNTKCLEAGLKLREEFKGKCEVQLCAFAQLPCFSGPDAGKMVRKLMEQAARHKDVDVLGSTPYVETDIPKMQQNVEWISQLALDTGKHLDFHMDYHLDEGQEPFIWDALRILQDKKWHHSGGKSICMGHCTRLTLFKSKTEWKRIHDAVSNLSISFIGLPTSDLFMMRTASGVRGTLNIVDMIEQHGFEAAIAINNVGNAFTPQGNCDPLGLASLCVGVYHAGTKRDADILYQTVSTRAKSAIGFLTRSLSISRGDPADFVVFESCQDSWQTKKSIAEIVYNPSGGRTVVKDGRVIVG